MTENALHLIAAKQVGWDCYLLVWSNGVRQQCSQAKYHDALNLLESAKK